MPSRRWGVPSCIWSGIGGTGTIFMMEKTKHLSESNPVVLAVDDDPAVLRVIEALLTRNGYVVKTASSGG